MKSTRMMVVLLAVGFFLAGFAPTWAQDQDQDADESRMIALPIGKVPYDQAKLREARIQELVRAGNYALAQAQTAAFEKWLKVYGHALDEFIVRNYDTRALCQEKRGEYDDAANTIRTSHSWKANPQNIQKVMDYVKKEGMQKEFFAKKSEYLSTMTSIDHKVLELAKRKETLIRDFLKQNPKNVKKSDLEKLQAMVKELNQSIAGYQKEKKEIAAKFHESLKQYDGIVFTAKQKAEISRLSGAMEKVESAIRKTQDKAQKGLTEIVEKFKWGWEGLDETLGKMQKLQDEIMGLHKKMLEVMAKQPLTDADKKQLLDYKASLDKLMSRHAELMAEIEKGFMDAKIFAQLTPDQQARYFKIFEVIRQAATAIEAVNRKVEAFIKQMTFKFGDLNGDGKIDQGDLGVMSQYLTQLVHRPMIYPYPNYPKPYNRAADLNGDGLLTWADYDLLKSAVAGDRKTFPVDPANVKGDMNGDGALDNEDFNALINVIFNPKEYLGAWRKVADLNGDGKIDFTDAWDLIKKIQEKDQPVSNDEPHADTATGTADTASASIEVTGEGADGASGADTNNASGTSASGIDSAY